MPMSSHRVIRSGSIALFGLLTCALAMTSCSPSRHSADPPTPLHPTIVGIIAGVSLTDTGRRVTLTDGRTVDEPDRGGFLRMGSGSQVGNLLLARPGESGFSDGLDSSVPGCWEAWQGPSSNPIVWDMGDSILFPSGLELPKAPGFHVDPQPHDVDGRLAWTTKSDGTGMNFCANSGGQIEWGKPQS